MTLDREHDCHLTLIMVTHCAQVVVNYVAMTPEGRIFDNSLAKNSPYFIRVGTGQVLCHGQTAAVYMLLLPFDILESPAE